MGDLTVKGLNFVSRLGEQSTQNIDNKNKYKLKLREEWEQ